MSTQPTPEWQPIATAPKERGEKFRIAKQHSETGRLIDFGIWENHEPAFVDPSMTHWAPAPLPETSTEPKEGGEICPTHASPTAGQPPEHPVPSAPAELTVGSNAAAGTSNPDQQAASVQLPWLEQQQSDREALAAETDQAPPQESKDRQWKVCEKHNAIFKRYACPLCEKELDAAIMPTIQDSTPQESADDGVKPCILNLDSPSYPPRLEEYLECGCASCLEVYAKLSTPAVAEQELMPCPFCGQMPNVEECEEGQGVYVWCETKECPMHGLSPSRDKWNRRPAATVAVGETPETDAKWQELMHSSEQWPRVSELLRDCARNLERQLAVARRERDEARKIVRETSWMARRYADGRMTHAANTFNTAIEPAYSAGWLSPMLSNEAYARDGNFSGEWLSIEQQRDAATAERDELRHKVYMPADWCCDKCKFTWHRRVISAATGQIGAPIMEEVPTCPNDGEVMRRVTWVECAGDNQQAAHRAFDERDALTADRDRLREEFANFRATIRQALFYYWPNNLGNTDEEIVGAITRALTALATAQADIAKLCSVIAAAFAETAKPLNASVEYDARPTEWERLKKVQEILASAIDAASAMEGGQP